MTVLMICCSVTGYRLLQRLQDIWKRQTPDIEFVTVVKCRSLPTLTDPRSLADCAGEWFGKADAIVFLCAAGIAVRSIAPHLIHKSKDPAVIVMDETGSFCISLLSGHMGGANALTKQIAEMVGAVPVITTATDREHKFAVDDFARKNRLILRDWGLAKEISVRLLEERPVGFSSQLPVNGSVPQELCRGEADMGILVSYAQNPIAPWNSFLQLIPRVIIVGIGCRRGTGADKIGSAIAQGLQSEGILPDAVLAVASIDLKKEEEGILTWCREREIPFLTYSAEILEEQQGCFTESAFVKQVTGVSNVCERSAVAAGGTLLRGKQVYDGVTVALARAEGSVTF